MRYIRKHDIIQAKKCKFEINESRICKLKLSIEEIEFVAQVHILVGHPAELAQYIDNLSAISD